MSDRRRKKFVFSAGPLRMAALALAALFFGIAIGMLGNSLFGGGGGSDGKPAKDSSIRKPPREARSLPMPPIPAPDPEPAATAKPQANAATGATPPWLRYALAAPPADARPRIAVMIDDVGVDRKRSLRAIDLPGPLTMSLMTYAEDLPALARRARERGHELMVHVPMEPADARENPGPHALVLSLDAAEIRRRLNWGLDRFDGYVGINNHMGSKFSAAEPAMRVVMAEVKARGLLFVDSRTSAQSVGARVAQNMGVPNASRDIFLDNDERIEAIKVQLELLEQVARKQGYAIAIGHPRDATLAAVEEWLAAAPGRGFVLVPVSAIVRRAYSG